MRQGWYRSPPVMERTLLDDVKWGLAVLAGATLGYFVFDVSDASVLVGAVIAVVLVVGVLNLARYASRRREA